MSTELYLVCHKCKKTIHVGCLGFSGTQFWSDEEKCMEALREFLTDHAYHKPVVLTEGFVYELDGYSEMEWRA